MRMLPMVLNRKATLQQRAAALNEADEIAELSDEQRTQLATMGLAGYRVHLGKETMVGNRWWSATWPNGRHMTATGGLKLSDVVGRMWPRYLADEHNMRAG